MIQIPIRPDVSTDTNFFAVFRANILNEDEILAFIDAEFKKTWHLIKTLFRTLFWLDQSVSDIDLSNFLKISDRRNIKNGAFWRSTKPQPLLV